MAGEGAVRVEGLQALNASLHEFDRKLQRELQKAIREIAEPVAQDIRRRDAQHNPPFTAKTISGTKAGSSRGAAVVRQRAGKTSGKRADFGVIQMQKGFLPALKAAEPSTVLRVNKLLGELTTRFNVGGM